MRRGYFLATSLGPVVTVGDKLILRGRHGASRGFLATFPENPILYLPLISQRGMEVDGGGPLGIE